MKTANRSGKRSKANTPAQKRKGHVNPVLDLFASMDEDVLAMLRQSLRPDVFEPDDPVELFAEYLEDCTRDDVDEGERNDSFVELVEVLSETKVESNGGHREARERLQKVYNLLDIAIEAKSLDPVQIMMTAKLFSDAGLVVPDSVKQAMAEALRGAPPDSSDGVENDIVLSFLQLADQVGQNPFDIHDLLNSFLAGFPAEASVMLLRELIAGKKPLIDQAVAGFLLHSDAVVANSVAEALAASAKSAAVESSLMERLVRMRPWLPPARQAQLDSTIRSMRLKALPPVRKETPHIIKCYVSVCDGTGTRSLFVTQKLGARYQIACVMMKLAGVADAMIIPELSKSGMDGMLRQLKGSLPVTETDTSGIARMLALAIADNSVSGAPPPFKLVEVVEALGLGPVHPDHASPIEIITGLLADLLPDQTNTIAVARAHAAIEECDFAYQWFEAGEALEDLLYPVKSSKQRVAKLLKSYLPDRRHFWARQCAISALAMRGDEKTRHSPWRELALVGRDIASDLPLDQIPMMKQIAETSVRAFEQRL